MTFTLQMPLFLMESEGSHLNSIEGFSYSQELPTFSHDESLDQQVPPPMIATYRRDWSRGQIPSSSTLHRVAVSAGVPRGNSGYARPLHASARLRDR